MARPSQAGAWWLPILEKAYAKFNLNYGAIESGSTIEAFRDLTGMPTQKWTVDEMTEDEIMDLIRWADEKHYVMGGGVSKSIDGLWASHAYTILGISDMTDSQG